MNEYIFDYIIGLIAGIVFIPTIYLIIKYFTIQVENETNVLICKFGKLSKVITEPGLHLWIQKVLPWNKIYHVSLKKDFRCFEGIHVNDSRGTTIIIDLWVEFKIYSPEKALFQVENLEKFLQSVLANSATATLGTYEFKKILSSRNQVCAVLKENIKNEAERWGLSIDFIFISKLSLHPDVSQQLMDTIAAQLEKTKADVEEAGRLDAQILEAETASKVANLVAEARGQYSLSVSKAYKKLSNNYELLEAYKRLYELSLLKPHRTVAFHGFSEHEVKSMEAAMTLPPPFDDGSSGEGAQKSLTLNATYAKEFNSSRKI